MLIRVFLGWLWGERGHCGMVAIPTLEAEDAKRPSRERESLVAERTRVANRMKSALARLGIRGFKPELDHGEDSVLCRSRHKTESSPWSFQDCPRRVV